MLTAEREPLADIITIDKEVKVTVEMLGITKQDIKVSAYESTVERSQLLRRQRGNIIESWTCHQKLI
jgi:HSP20 family protein